MGAVQRACELSGRRAIVLARAIVLGTAGLFVRSVSVGREDAELALVRSIFVRRVGALRRRGEGREEVDVGRDARPLHAQHQHPLDRDLRFEFRVTGLGAEFRGRCLGVMVKFMFEGFGFRIKILGFRV